MLRDPNDYPLDYTDQDPRGLWGTLKRIMEGKPTVYYIVRKRNIKYTWVSFYCIDPLDGKLQWMDGMFARLSGHKYGDNLEGVRSRGPVNNALSSVLNPVEKHFYPEEEQVKRWLDFLHTREL